MIRNIVFLVGAWALIASAAESQTGEAKKSVAAGEGEITFANGSVVRMTLLPDEIEIRTDFGKLSVPVRQIRRIDFGLHLPEGADKKIAAAIKKLGSPQYKEREDAVRELVALGAYAYPSLVRVVNSSDPESTKRALDAMAKIKARVPAKDLILSEDDKIITPRFTIVGRIITPVIKAKSEYFGDAEHALTRLRVMRMISDARELEVVLDAAKYGLANQWLDTGLTLENAHTLSILATGEVELRPSTPGTYVCGPRGYTRVAAGFGGKGKKNSGDPARAYPGTLLGRIGANGEPFVIGERFEGSAEREGKLFLQIMPSSYENTSAGSYQVKISVRD